jgi:hypothetical protein
MNMRTLARQKNGAPPIPGALLKENVLPALRLPVAEAALEHQVFHISPAARAGTAHTSSPLGGSLGAKSSTIGMG